MAAMFKVTVVRVDGFRELKDALEELPKATGANVLRRALIKAGEPVAVMAKGLAPKRRGELESSISVQSASPSKMTRTGRSAYDKQSKVEVVIEAGPNPQATMQEFGTVNHPPQPFMRPAWQASKFQVLESIKEQLWKEIEKAAQRLARKAAKLAAAEKGG